MKKKSSLPSPVLIERAIMGKSSTMERMRLAAQVSEKVFGIPADQFLNHHKKVAKMKNHIDPKTTPYFRNQVVGPSIPVEYEDDQNRTCTRFEELPQGSSIYDCAMAAAGDVNELPFIPNRMWILSALLECKKAFLTEASAAFRLNIKLSRFKDWRGNSLTVFWPTAQKDEFISACRSETERVLLVAWVDDLCCLDLVPRPRSTDGSNLNTPQVRLGARKERGLKPSPLSGSKLYAKDPAHH